MQKVFNIQKIFLIALVLLSFMGTSLVTAQGYELAEAGQSALNYENLRELSIAHFTQENAITTRDAWSIGYGENPAPAVKPPHKVTQSSSPLRLAVTDLPAEGASLQQRRKEEKEKWGTRQPTFPELDINQDEVISREEARLWIKLDKEFERIDEDHDDKIDRSEFLEFETEQLKKSILDFSRGSE